MPTSFTLGNVAVILAVVLPVAGILTLIFILVAVRRWRHSQTITLINETEQMRRDGGATMDLLLKKADRPSERLSVGEAAGRSAQAGVLDTAADLQANLAPKALAPKGQSPQVLIDKITAAEAISANTEIAGLYLSLAQSYMALGRHAEALKALQSAAGISAMHGPPHVHAMSRVELAEAALKAGDLTGACEQWQIAKVTYHNHGQHADYALVDRRMRDNGCPTDWVLTEF